MVTISVVEDMLISVNTINILFIKLFFMYIKSYVYFGYFSVSC